jgi:hypothetical protein
VLAHLADQAPVACRPIALDPTLAVEPEGDQGGLSRAAYEVAAALDAACWIPSRRVTFDPERADEASA